MSYTLGQVDPAPPPMRPVSWPMILGWTAVVGVTLAIFNGTINLGGGRVRANKRTSRRRSSRRNTGRRSSHARPKPPKFSEMAIWQAVAAVRETGKSSEVASILPPGVAARFRRLAPGLYKYGRGPKKGEVFVQFKNAGLKGAMTSTRIGAKAVGEYHWVVDNFDPKFPVVIRGIDDHGGTYWRVEEHVKQHARVPVLVRRKSESR